MTAEEIVIRASSTPTALDCQRRWAAKTIPEQINGAGFALRRIGTHIGAPIGTGLHALGAHLLKVKLDTGEPGLFKDAAEIGIGALREALADAEDIRWDNTAGKANDAERQVVRMGVVYADQVVPKITPVMVEQRLKAKVDDGYIASGQADNLATLDPADNTLRDTKTGREPRAAAPQMGFYRLLIQSHGMRVNRAVIDFIPRKSLSTVQPAPIETEVDLDEAEQLATFVLDDGVRAIKQFLVTGNPMAFRANPSSQLCSERYCPAHGSKFCRAPIAFN